MAPTRETAVGVEGRLDDRQIFELEGKVVSLECLLKDWHIEIACAQHIAHRAAELAAVAVDKLLHHIVVRHLDDGGQTLESVGCKPPCRRQG